MNTNDSKSPQTPKDPTRNPENTASASNEKKKTAQNQTQREHEKIIENLNFKGNIYQTMKANREQIITYTLLVLGLILILFSNILLGGLIIGMVAGFYFSEEITHYLRNLGQIMGGQNQIRYVVLAAIALGLFIEAPGIFIGAVVVATFKQVVTGPKG